MTRQPTPWATASLRGFDWHPVNQQLRNSPAMNPTRQISSWRKVSGASIGLAVMTLPLAAVVGPQASAGGTADRTAPPHPVTRLISKVGPGRPANAGSQGVAINADCTAVAFSSVASNLT